MLNLWNMLQANPTLFDGIELPERLESDDVVNAILLEGAQLAPIYGDPGLLHEMILHYFHTRLWVHQQLVDLLDLEYDPISNYDRTETSSDTDGGSKTINRSRMSAAHSETSGSASRDVSAYDSSTMQPSEASTTGGESGSFGVDHGHDTESTTGTRSHTSRIKGNIGVTTSQQMIESSVELMGIMDVYRYISLDFIHTFCIMVY